MSLGASESAKVNSRSAKRLQLEERFGKQKKTKESADEHDNLSIEEDTTLAKRKEFKQSLRDRKELSDEADTPDSVADGVLL